MDRIKTGRIIMLRYRGERRESSERYRQRMYFDRAGEIERLADAGDLDGVRAALERPGLTCEQRERLELHAWAWLETRPEAVG